MRTYKKELDRLQAMAIDTNNGEELSPEDRKHAVSFFSNCDVKMTWGGDRSDVVLLAKFACFTDNAIRGRLAGRIVDALMWEKHAEDCYNLMSDIAKW